MYPVVERFIDVATVGLVLLVGLAVANLALAWWRSRGE